MAEFRKLSPEDVRQILQSYGAPLYRAHMPIPAGTINTNVRIQTDGGIFFLRVNEGKTPEDVQREAAIVAHAARHGVATPSPLPASDGAPFARWNGLPVSMFPWLDGRTLARSEVMPTHAAAAGAALARLHLASPGFADQRPGRYEPEEIARRLNAVAALARPELTEAMAVLRPELAALSAERAAVELPLGIIHGDLFIDNVLYGPDGRLVALLDFEQASWGRFVYDLAVTTLAFGYGRDDFRPDVTRALLDGYCAVRPPTPAEREAFGAELRFAACRFAVTRITDVHLKRGAGAAPGKRFERYLQRLASIRAHLAAADGLLAL